MTKFPEEWLKQIPAVVFASLLPGEIQIFLFPGDAHAYGGVRRDVPFNQIPPELRMPNTLLWVDLNEEMNIIRVWRRENEVESS